MNFEKLENAVKETCGPDYGCEPLEVVKNGVDMSGIRIIKPESPEICPVIYYSDEDTFETVLSRIIVAAGSSPDIDIDRILEREFIRENIYLAVSRRDGEDRGVLRRNYLNLDLIMKLRSDGQEDCSHCSIKVTEGLLKAAGIDEAEAWENASANSRKTAKIRSMAEVLGLPVEVEEMTPLCVGTCSDGIDGASVLYMPDLFRDFCLERGIDEALILPSSTQEVIVLGEMPEMPVSDLEEMVRTINSEEVDPLIQLEPAVYRYSLCDNTVSIVA